MKICKRVESVEHRDGGALAHTNCADILVVFLREDILRIRVSFDRKMDEASYILTTTAWPDRLDDIMGAERTRLEPFSPEIRENEMEIQFITPAVRLVLDREKAAFRLYDREGTLLHEDLPGGAYTCDLGTRVTHYSRMEEDDCFYGFGEKTGLLNKNKSFLRERATDAMGYDPCRADTLYKHIPFYIRLMRESRKAVGLFYHNTFESCFNMGCEKSNYRPRYSYFQADGGDIDLFLLAGTSIRRILEQYTFLTGRPILLPKRALGYQGSSMYYAELASGSDSAVLEFVDTAREEGFPMDGFHLSSGYTSVDTKRCVFTWNAQRFPDPEGFFAAMNSRGAQVVPNVKPGVLLTHPSFEAWRNAGVFVKDSESPEAIAEGYWWGGTGAFWDFTDPGARNCWKQELKEKLLAVGTDSVWNDNCEYDSLTDKDARCSYDGAGGTIGALKPVMSNLMCRLSNEAVRENSGLRPYTVCRSGTAGIQRYAQTWAGDNATGWESLRYNIPTILGMGLSGQPNEGADIGGFAGPAPEEELFIRWVQQGIFQPRFSIHSASTDNTVTEPWMFRESTGRIRDAIALRYRLAPYLYSCEYEASQTGAPIMRPLVYEFQNDPKVYEKSFDYLFGRDLLIANVLEPGAAERSVYLPAGCCWYDWNDRMHCYCGGSTIRVPVTLDSIPIFLREGGCVAMSDVPLQHMTDPVKRLRLLIAPSGVNATVLYDDDGLTEDYRSGVYRKTTVTVRAGQLTTVDFASEGSFPDTVETVTIELIAKEKCPYWAELDGVRLPHYLHRGKFEQAEAGWYYSQSRRTVELRYPNPRRDCRLTVSFEQFDLIGM